MNLLAVLNFCCLLSIALAIQYYLTDFRYSKKKSLILIFSLFLVCLFEYFIVTFTVGIETFRRLYPLLINIPAFSIYFYFSRYRNFKTLFSCLSTVFLSGMITCFAYLFSMLFHGAAAELADILCRAVLGLCIIFFIKKYIRVPYLSMLRTLDHGWGLFCLIPVAFYGIFYILFMKTQTLIFLPERMLLTLFIILIIGVFYIVVSAVFRQNQERLQIKYQQELMKSQVSALNQQVEAITKYAQEAKIQRHDMRHYLRNIAVLLEEDHTKDAMQFIREWNEQIESSSLPALCENPALDAIIRYYLEKAREKGIQTEYHLDIPARLSVSDAELSVVFANALENAIRACENLGEGKSKKIMISCASRPKFVMQISNTCGKVSFNQDGFPISSREGHGLGIKSIQAFAEKNNALLDYELNKDTLTMSMLIQ